MDLLEYFLSRDFYRGEMNYMLKIIIVLIIAYLGIKWVGDWTAEANAVPIDKLVEIIWTDGESLSGLNG